MQQQYHYMTLPTDRLEYQGSSCKLYSYVFLHSGWMNKIFSLTNRSEKLFDKVHVKLVGIPNDSYWSAICNIMDL